MGLYKKSVKNADGEMVLYWQARIQYRKRRYTKVIGRVDKIRKSLAQKIHDEMIYEIKFGKYVDKESDYNCPTLNEFSIEYLDFAKNTIQKRSWKRDRLSLKNLKKALGSFAINEITPNHLINYQTKRLGEGKKPATVNRELSCLRSLINVAIKREVYSGRNPVSGMKFLEENNQIERILTLEEEVRLLNSSPPHLKPIIITALNTGLRKSEILHLKWENVNLKNDIVTIQVESSKNKRQKRIPLNSKMKALLNSQYAITGNTEYVFLNSRGMPFKDYNSIKTSFSNACKKANITGLRFHDLRHSCASRMVENGANIVAVSKILGHSTLSITMRYLHPDKSLIEAVESLNITKEGPKF